MKYQLGFACLWLLGASVPTAHAQYWDSYDVYRPVYDTVYSDAVYSDYTTYYPSTAYSYPSTTYSAPYTAYRIEYDTVEEQVPVTTYKYVWETEMRERRYTVAKPVYETSQREERYTVRKPVWETSYREETVQKVRYVRETSEREETYTVRKPVYETTEREQRHTVLKPVYETSMRDQAYTVLRPVTSYRTQYVQRGGWVNQQVYSPGYLTRQYACVGGWMRPVYSQTPGVVYNRPVYQSNLVAEAVPQTSFVPTTEVRKVPVQTLRYERQEIVRKVPVQTVRYVEERHVKKIPVVTERPVVEREVRKIPVRTCKWVEEEFVRKIPVTTMTMKYEQQVKEEPVRVCRRVAVEGTQTVRRYVAKRVPVTYYRVDNGCTSTWVEGSPPAPAATVIRSAEPTPASDLDSEAPAIDPEERIDVVPENGDPKPIRAKKPTSEESKDPADDEPAADQNDVGAPTGTLEGNSQEPQLSSVLKMVPVQKPTRLVNRK